MMAACAVEVQVPDGKGGEKTFCLTKPGLLLQALCDTCPLFASMIWDLVTAPSDRQEQYLQKLEQYMQCRERAYNDTDPKPKLHYLAHADGEVDCFPLERRHKTGINHGSHASSQDGLSWSRHILARNLLEQVSRFQELPAEQEWWRREGWLLHREETCAQEETPQESWMFGA